MAPAQTRFVKARSRRTGEINVRREEEFSFYSLPKNPEYILHYVGTDGTRVCRCDDTSKHFSHTITVARENRHLAASLMQYLIRHNYESCTVAAYRKYRDNRKAKWLAQGVHTDNFHYMSDAKDKVCRCSRPNGHYAGTPRNAEIIEQCAEFFVVHKDMKFCKRTQWQGVEGDAPPVHSACAQSPIHPTPAHSPRSHKPIYSPESHHDAFEYDSRSTHELLHDRAQRVSTPSEVRVRDVAKPVVSTYAQQPPQGPHGEPDIPVKVWETARPSVWVTSHGSDSDITTPLGTALPQTFSPTTPQAPLPVVASAKVSQRTSTSDYRSSVQNKAGRLSTQRPGSQASQYTVKPEALYETPEGNLSRRSHHELPSRTHEPVPVNDFELHATSTAELPGQIAALEIGAGTTRHSQRHSGLSPRDSRPIDGLSELPGKRNTVNASHTPSTPTTSLPPLSLLFKQVHDQLRLPDQEELLLHHAIVSSRANPAPAGACTECNEPLQDRQKRTFMLPECNHFIHEDCLLETFRIRDQRIGTCPVCNAGLCERTLADRIDTDRMAIFGSQFTRLRNQVSIKFPQHNETVTCASEEEVAVAQLRLIKDSVDVHSEENFSKWEINRAEPDWFMGITRPVVKLFQAWDIPDRKCRFFVDHEHFLKLLAWAELVRLMNYGRKASLIAQGQDAMYPQLSELHHKFELALARYDKEKLVWGQDEGRIPECDQVAQDVVDLAMRIRSS